MDSFNTKGVGLPKKQLIIGIDGSRAFGTHKTGTENYSYQLLTNLAKIDHKNEYIIYLRSQSQVIRSNWPDNFHFKVIDRSRFWTQIGLSRQTFIDDIDVLFVPAHTVPLIHRAGLKTVVTVHDLGSEFLPYTHQLKQRLYLSFMQRFQLKRADKIIAVSDATKLDLIKKLGIDSRKIKVVYEGYNEKVFKQLKGDSLINSLRGYDLLNHSYFLFVGTVQPRKNLERLISAFDRFLKDINAPLSQNSPKKPLNISSPDPKSINLVIVGQKGWMTERIYELPKTLGIVNSVKFLNYVSDQDLPALYSGALGLVFPSLFEGFGLPILEAQKCGCPVLTSNLSSMPEIAGEGAIEVNPYSVQSIAKGMYDLTNQKIREKVIKKGFKNIERFSWERAAWETLQVIEEAAKS